MCLKKQIMCFVEDIQAVFSFCSGPDRKLPGKLKKSLRFFFFFSQMQLWMILIYYGIQHRKSLLGGVLAHQKIVGENAPIMTCVYSSISYYMQFKHVMSGEENMSPWWLIAHPQLNLSGNQTVDRPAHRSATTKGPLNSIGQGLMGWAPWEQARCG